MAHELSNIVDGAALRDSRVKKAPFIGVNDVRGKAIIPFYLSFSETFFTIVWWFDEAEILVSRLFLNPTKAFVAFLLQRANEKKSWRIKNM